MPELTPKSVDVVPKRNVAVAGFGCLASSFVIVVAAAVVVLYVSTRLI